MTLFNNNNQRFSIGLRFAWNFSPSPFSWLSNLYSTAFCIFLIACLDFSVSRILLDEQSIINAFVCQRISVSILFCSLGPRSTNNQLFLHVVDTALHLLSISSWPSWPVFKYFCQTCVCYNSCNWPQFVKYPLFSFWTIYLVPSVDQYLIHSPKFCKYFCADCFLCNIGLRWTNSHFSFFQVVKSASRLLFLYSLLLTDRYQKIVFKLSCQFLAIFS